MKFSEAAKAEEPTFAVYNEVNKLIFNEGEGREYMDRVSKEAAMIFKLYCFEGEILNGGMDQLFFNSAGDYIGDIIEGLEFYAAESYLNCLNRTLKFFPNHMPSKNRELRQKQLRAIEENQEYRTAVNEAETEFYCHKDGLVEKMDKFIIQNPTLNVES